MDGLADLVVFLAILRSELKLDEWRAMSGLFFSADFLLLVSTDGTRRVSCISSAHHAMWSILMSQFDLRRSNEVPLRELDSFCYSYQ